MTEPAHAVVHNMPAAVRPSDETELSESRGGIAKDIGMVSRIDSVQAAGDDEPASIVVSCLETTHPPRSRSERPSRS